ncbi:MAG: site-specific DNA-methyltransferase [Spirochaetes bacterium]|nr:site-specific DNA-methyltransferase [Spirochaetota bacterium]
MKPNQIIHGDAMNILPSLKDKSVDLVITDPPFAIDFKARKANYNRKYKNVLEGYNEIPSSEYLEFSLNWIKQIERILKKSGSAYIISGWTNLKDILIAVEKAGFILLNHIIWKYQFGVFTRKKFVTSHYHILLCVKSKDYVFNKIDHYPEDVWAIKREYWHNKLKTPTKLPADLVKKMLLYSSREGDLVLDPFSGSGTVPVCCRQLKRKFLGIEINKDYVNLSHERLRDS